MKTVWITGASRGIGAQTARVFAANGYAVALNYYRSEREAMALTEEIRQAGGVALPIQADVSNEKEVKAAAATVREQLGVPDVIIHNAGIAQQVLFADMTADEWHRMMGVHLDGAFYTFREWIPEMVNRHSGVLLTVSSVWGEVGASCEAAYSAAKAGLIGLTRSLAKELGPAGIRVNGVAPGVIDTEMCAPLGKETLRSLAEEMPLGRLGTPEDVANVLYFLASDSAAFITGQVMRIDGGWQ